MVEGEADIGRGGSGFLVLIEGGADLQHVAVEVRTVRQVADRAAQRAGTVERALRPKQDFDALKIVQLEVDEERDFAEIGRDRAATIIVAVTGIDRVGVEAADNDRVALTATAINNVDTRNIGEGVSKILKALFFDLGTADGRNIERHVLDSLGAARGRNNDYVL